VALDPKRAPPQACLALGMPGITAGWPVEIGQPKPADRRRVGRPGAVGSVVGQLADRGRAVGRRRRGEMRLRGERARLRHAASTKAGDLLQNLKTHCRKASTTENVGGAVLGTLLAMNCAAHLCAAYRRIQRDAASATRCCTRSGQPHPHAGNDRVRWKDRYGEAIKDLGAHLAAGRIKYRIDRRGLDSAPRG
jgi:NADPH-dependent curcumin reductase CurA